MKYQILLVSAIIAYATKFDKSRAPESQLSNAEVGFQTSESTVLFGKFRCLRNSNVAARQMCMKAAVDVPVYCGVATCYLLLTSSNDLVNIQYFSLE